MSAKVTTCLWFDSEGLEAARLYVSLLPDSKLGDMFTPDPSKPPLVVNFTLAGSPYQALNGGPMFKHSEAASIAVLTDSQDETDRLWAALTANGGSESHCGWLKDRFGVSWQIVPRDMLSLLMHTDRAAAARAMQAMLAMGKIDMAAIQAAFDGRG